MFEQLYDINIEYTNYRIYIQVNVDLTKKIRNISSLYELYHALTEL